MDRNGRLQAVGRLPRTKTHAGNEFSYTPSGLQGHRNAVAGQQIALRRQTAELDLQALQRRIHIPHRATDRALFAQYVPRLECLTQLQRNTADGVIADLGKTKLQMRRKPFGPYRITGSVEINDDVGKILFDKVRQQEPVVQLRAPARQFWRRVRLTPEPRDQRPQQQLLSQAHARMRRHFKGAQLKQTKAPRRAVRRVELVDAELGAVGVAGDIDQQISQQPVDQPRRTRFARFRHLCKGNFQFIQGIVSRLVDARRLGRGADEQPGKQVGQRRMVMPVTDQATQ
ncbi:hypothetical protein D3C87_1390640 [compost metagenome]